MPAENQVTLEFSRGINAAARARDIDPRECTKGENFALDLDFGGWRRRKAFDLVATAPNGGRINGYAQLVKADGTISTLIQAAEVVYDWDGGSTFTQVATVNNSARLRGPRDQIWTLDDIVIITDLAKIETVKQWDGTTFSTMTENLSGDFIAKYCFVENEVAYFANVSIGGADTPHVLLASKRGDNNTLDSSTRALLTVNQEDAWFLPIPDFRPINALENNFGKILVSTERGRLYQLLGTSSFDYELVPMYANSAAAGDEAVVNIGNDLIIGRAGNIDALSGVQNFGDVETDDLDRWIHPLIEDVVDWRLVYNPTLHKVYCFPKDRSECFVLHKSILLTGDGSPWSKWTTTQEMSFQPTTMIPIRRPSDGVDVVYLGGSDGSIYELEGTGAQDGGTDNITSFRVSGTIDPPRDPSNNNQLVFDQDGFVDYRRLAANTFTLTFQHGGVNFFDQNVTVPIEDSADFAVYDAGTTSSDYYDEAGNGPSSFYGIGGLDRTARKTFSSAGQSSSFAVKGEITGSAEFEIDQIGLNFSKK